MRTIPVWQFVCLSFLAVFAPVSHAAAQAGSYLEIVSTLPNGSVESFVVTDALGGANDPSVSKMFVVTKANAFLAQVDSAYNGYYILMAGGFYNLEALRFPDATVYRGFLPYQKELRSIAATFRKFWRYQDGSMIFGGTRVVDDLDGSTKQNGRLTLTWGSKRLTLDKTDNAPGACHGEIQEKGTTLRSFECTSNGSMTDILFSDPDHLALWLITFFID